MTYWHLDQLIFIIAASLMLTIGGVYGFILAIVFFLCMIVYWKHSLDEVMGMKLAFILRSIILAFSTILFINLAVKYANGLV